MQPTFKFETSENDEKYDASIYPPLSQESRRFAWIVDMGCGVGLRTQRSTILAEHKRGASLGGHRS